MSTFYRKAALICAAAAAGACFAQRRYRSNVRQYQASRYLLTKRKPALVIRAVQLVLQESIGAIGVPHAAARMASPASGPRSLALLSVLPAMGDARRM